MTSTNDRGHAEARPPKRPRSGGWGDPADRVVIEQIREPTEEDYRELARLLRDTHTRTAARHDRERLAAGRRRCQCEICQWVRAAGQPAGGPGPR